jgi:hypothetical protein
VCVCVCVCVCVSDVPRRSCGLSGSTRVHTGTVLELEGISGLSPRVLQSNTSPSSRNRRNQVQKYGVVRVNLLALKKLFLKGKGHPDMPGGGCQPSSDVGHVAYSVACSMSSVLYPSGLKIFCCVTPILAPSLQYFINRTTIFEDEQQPDFVLPYIICGF